MPDGSFVDMSFPAFETPMEKAERERKAAEIHRKINALRQKEAKPGESVKRFHKAMGQPVGDEPHFLEGDRLDFRLTLIEEEWGEFLEAVEDDDLPNAFKELADMVYVIYGLAVEMGGDLDAVFDEVHRSNMTKMDNDGVVKYRDDGKVLKPDNYSPADIKRVLGL